VGSINDYRSFYARLIVGRTGNAVEALIEAFSVVPRESFLGSGPWDVMTRAGYVSTETDDPRIVYQDTVIALLRDREINNGQPGMHAHAMAVAKPGPGESVIHVGAGTGYYSAVLAELVGPEGSVNAYEVEPELSARAKGVVSRWPNVVFHAASAAEGPLPSSDVIYVSAGATHPLDVWLDALRPRGRLVLPLTGDEDAGEMLIVTHVGAQKYAARFVFPVQFIPCLGARDEQSSRALVSAFAGPKKSSSVRSLVRSNEPDNTAWCVGKGWWLSSASLD
jgi:protein-L-isoaspartate(D-aspartate) O-methyltransferase